MLTIAPTSSAAKTAAQPPCACPVLPFQTPLLSTYLYFAFVLGASPASENLIVNNFIQLSSPFLPGNNLPIGFVPMLGTDHCFRDTFTPSVGFDAVVTASPTSKDSFAENIESFLGAGRYVHLLLDEYYIPERTSFHRRHFVHENLVVGFCPQCRMCQVVGYVKRSGANVRATEVFGISRCRIEELADAYTSTLSIPTDRPAHQSISGFLPDTKPQMADRRWIKAQLNEYLQSTHTPQMYLSESRRFKPSMVEPSPSLKNIRYGLKVYDALTEILHRGANNGDPGFLSAFRIFWEHKLAAALRASVLLGKDSPLSQRFEAIQASANAIRLKTIFHRIQRRQETIAEIESRLHAMKDEETSAVQALMAAL